MNIWDKARDPVNLKFLLSMGYFKKDEAVKVDKFSRAVLQNGIVATIGSFNESVSVTNFKPFNDTLGDLSIQSDNASDTHAIKIYYINGDRDLKEATVTLQGLTPINLATELSDTVYAIWRMRNISSVDNAGTITIADGSDNIYCNMPITSGIPANSSLTGIFSIPRGYVGLLLDVSISLDKGADAKGAIFTRKENGVFLYGKALASFENQSVYSDIFLTADEKTDVLPIAVAQTGGVIYLDYTLILIKKEIAGKYL